MKLKIAIKILEKKKFKKHLIKNGFEYHKIYGYTRWKKRGEYIICLDKDTPEKERSFILLHELGHTFSDFLHIPKKIIKIERTRLLKDPIFCVWELNDKEKEKLDEIYANLFYFYKGKNCSSRNHFKLKYPKTWNLYAEQLKNFKPSFKLIKKEVLTKWISGVKMNQLDLRKNKKKNNRF